GDNGTVTDRIGVTTTRGHAVIHCRGGCALGTVVVRVGALSIAGTGIGVIPVAHVFDDVLRLAGSHGAGGKLTFGSTCRYGLERAGIQTRIKKRVGAADHAT